MGLDLRWESAVQIRIEIWQKQTKIAIINFEYFKLFKLCHFLTTYNDPNLSIKLLDSLLTTL